MSDTFEVVEMEMVTYSSTIHVLCKCGEEFHASGKTADARYDPME